MGDRPQKQVFVKPGLFMGEPVSAEQYEKACVDIGMSDEISDMIKNLFVDAKEYEADVIKNVWKDGISPDLTNRMHKNFDIFKEVESKKRDVSVLTDDRIDSVYYDLRNYGYIVAYASKVLDVVLDYPYTVSESRDAYRSFVRERYGGLATAQPESRRETKKFSKPRFEASRYEGENLEKTRSVKVSSYISDTVEHVVKTKIDSSATWQDITDGVFAFIVNLDDDPKFVPSKTVSKIIEYFRSNQPSGALSHEVESSLESVAMQVENYHKNISSDVYALESMVMALLADKVFGLNIGIDKLSWDKNFIVEVKPNRSEKSLEELRLQWHSIAQQGFEEYFKKKN